MTATARPRAGVLAVSSMLVITGCATELVSSPASSSAVAPTTAAEKQVDGQLAQRLDAAVNATMKATQVPGAIVGLWGPDGQYVRAFGVADRATGAPMALDFHQRIGSVTKTFTVTALLQLVDQGKVNLDDPIAKYVDGVPNGEQITLRQLARMQSGLHNYTAIEAFQQQALRSAPRAFTPRELLDVAFAVPNDFAPGQRYAYSNTNTVLLGLTVQKVSGQSLPDFISDHILIPLRLSHTTFPTDNAFPNPHAQGYTSDGAKEVVATDWNPSWGWAAGAMISTLGDLHLWTDALAGGTLLTPHTQQQRLQTVNLPGLPPPDGYGLGILSLAGWVGHDGDLPGYETLAVHLADKQMTLVIMINTGNIPAPGGPPIEALATSITSIVTPDHVYPHGG